MKLTLEHALILILTIVVIYYVVQHRNLVKDLVDSTKKFIKPTIEGSTCMHNIAGINYNSTPVEDANSNNGKVYFNKTNNQFDLMALPGGAEEYDLNFSKSGDGCANVQFSNLDTSFHDLTDNQITMLVDHACKSMCGDDPNPSLGIPY